MPHSPMLSTPEMLCAICCHVAADIKTQIGRQSKQRCGGQYS
jgi:hypothetical protein